MGLSFFVNSITLLSKKYKPVTAKLDFVFFGFSTSLITFFFYLIVATP